MKKNKYIIQDYPYIIKFFASVNPLHLALYVFIMLFALEKFSIAKSLDFSLLFFSLGVFYWTFLEYFIHRYVYHVNFKSKLLHYTIGSFHLYHHSNLKDPRVLNSGFLMIIFVAPLVTLPFLLFFSLASTVSMMIGLICMYFCYECVHYFIHYREYKSGYLSYIQKYHMHHHCHAPLKNFGNTSHFWDLVFNTYDSKYKKYQMSDKVKDSLIVSQKASQSAYA